MSISQIKLIDPGLRIILIIRDAPKSQILRSEVFGAKFYENLTPEIKS